MFEAPLYYVLPVRLASNSNAKKGADGYYHHVTGDLGVKVYRQPDSSMAQREYLLTCYAFEMTGNAAEPLAYSNVDVPLGPEGEMVSRPALFMRHIEGMNVVDKARELGWLHNGTFDKDEAEEWGYTSPEFVAIAERILSVCEQLQSHGFQCHDHLENFGNWMINKRTGKVSAIDFSVEADNIDLLRKIKLTHFHKLFTPVPATYVEALFEYNNLGLD